MVHRTLRCGVALSVLLSACATTQRADRPGGHVLVHIDNNLTPATAIWVWIVTEEGTTHALGGAEPSCAKIWRVGHEGAPIRLQLVARTATDLTISSPPFDVGPSEVVQWDIAVNSVTTSGGRHGGPLDALRPPGQRVAAWGAPTPRATELPLPREIGAPATMGTR